MQTIHLFMLTITHLLTYQVITSVETEVMVVSMKIYKTSYRAGVSVGMTFINTHQLNGPLSGTTQVSRYQKGKTNIDFTEARDNEWQWHQLGHMQVCTSLQTDDHASTPPLSFYRPDALPDAQPTASKH